MAQVIKDNEVEEVMKQIAEMRDRLTGGKPLEDETMVVNPPPPLKLASSY
jgi:hypothetical protein